MPEEKKQIKVVLTKKPQNVTMVEGFPGFGLIGTITTEYMLDHLECEKIGSYCFEDLPPTIAIHESKVVDPIGIFYNKKHNIVIVHSISGAQGVEWIAADVILEVAKQLKAKEIISIEGVGSAVETTTSNLFYHSRNSKIGKKLESMNVQKLKEGIIMGVTGALLVKDNVPLSCIFAETHSRLPDSNAAAKVIELLDKYIGMKIDPKPLREKAKEFEEKVKNILEQSASAEDSMGKKQLNYVG